MATAYQHAADLLACLTQRLEATSGGPLARKCVVAGDVAWDECCNGMLWVRITRLYPTRDFPADATGDFRCSDWRLAVDLEAGVLRCAPVVTGRGLKPDLPSCAQLDANAQLIEEQMVAMWCGMVDCAGVWQSPVNGGDSVQLGAITPLGPDGGCVGAQATLTVTVGNCRLCA